MTDIEKLIAGTSFSAEPMTIAPRVIWDITKKAKAGGTHFAVATVPSPVAYQGTDTGDDVLKKFEYGEDGVKRIVKSLYRHALPFKIDEADAKSGAPNADLAIGFADPTVVKNLFRGELARWDKDFHAMLGKARTIVWDTGTEFYEMCRLAQFGKLLQVKAQHYAPINRYIVELFNAVANQDYTSLITISQGQGEWVETGRKDKDGEPLVVRSKTRLARANWHDKVDFLVHAFFEARYIDPVRYDGPLGTMTQAFDTNGAAVPGKTVLPGGILRPGRFELELVRSRFSPEHVGRIWTNEEITFLNVAMTLYPDVDFDKWMDPHPVKNPFA